VPGRDLARTLAEWLAPAASSGWRDLPESVTATTGTSPDGRRVHFVHNWSWEPASVPAPVNLSDALTGTSIFAGSALDLGAWDVRVLVSTDTDSAPAVEASEQS
jgi:beta-galactosidase